MYRIYFVISRRATHGYLLKTPHGLSQHRLFNADHDGVCTALMWVHDHAPTPLHLVIDLPEETLIVEHTPPLKSADRLRYATRLRQQHFAQTVFCGTHWRHTAVGTHLALLGLTQTAALQYWIDALQGAGITIASLSSCALLQENLFTHPAFLPLPPRFLLALATDDGLRLSDIQNGHVMLSRIVPPAHETSLWHTLHQEQGKLLDYLASVQQLARHEQLPLVVIEDDALHADSKMPLDTRILALCSIPLSALLPPPATPYSSAALILHARGCPPHYPRQPSFSARPHPAFGLVLVLGLLLNIGVFWQTQRINHVQQQATQHITAMQYTLNSLHAPFAAPPLNIEQQIIILSRYQHTQLATHMLSKLPPLLALLTQTSTFQLQSLAWTQASSTAQPQFELNLIPTAATTPYRTQLTALQHLQTQLHNIGFHTQITQTPLRLTPQHTLQTQASHRFSLQLTSDSLK